MLSEPIGAARVVFHPRTISTPYQWVRSSLMHLLSALVTPVSSVAKEEPVTE